MVLDIICVNSRHKHYNIYYYCDVMSISLMYGSFTQLQRLSGMQLLDRE